MKTPGLHIGRREECREGFSGFAQERFHSCVDRALWLWNSPPQSLVVQMKSIDLSMSGQWIYLPGDYQGWHTNGDIPGQRIYYSWASESNKSGMRFMVDGQIIESPDKQGWNRRAFTPPIWHSVYCDCIRASVGFINRTDIGRFDDHLEPVSAENVEDLFPAA